MNEKGRTLVIQPDERESYWQSVRANGHVELHVSEHLHSPSIKGFDAGTQEVVPSCFVREH